MEYCYLCGESVEARGEYFLCGGCGQKIYQNPKPCVDLAIFNSQGQVLLAKRANDPAKGKYDLPGGFVDLSDRSLEEAMAREIQEEMDVSPGDIRDVRYAMSYTGNYPWGKDVYKNLIAVFVGYCDKEYIDARDDVEELRWFSPAQIKPDMLSSSMLNEVIKKLVEYNK